MTDLQLSLTAPERECLIGLLETALKEAQIEEHRTRAPSYRQIVLEHENAIKSVLTKLGKPDA